MTEAMLNKEQLLFLEKQRTKREADEAALLTQKLHKDWQDDDTWNGDKFKAYSEACQKEKMAWDAWLLACDVWHKEYSANTNSVYGHAK